MDSGKWIQAFKIALIEEDETALTALAGEMPDFKNIEEAKEAAVMIDRARKEFTKKRDSLKNAMTEMENTRKFLSSSVAGEGRLDIKS